MPSDISVVSLETIPGVGQNSVIAKWAPPPSKASLSYMQAANIEIYASATNYRNTATKAADAGPAGAIAMGTHTGLGRNVTRYYWARAVDAAGNYGLFFPTGLNSGIACTTKDEVPPPGSVGGEQIQDGSVQTRHVQEISADRLSVGTATGSTFQTNGSGSRAVLSAAANALQIYQSSGVVAKFGSPSTLSPLLTISGAFAAIEVSVAAVVAAATIQNTASSPNAHGLRGIGSSSSGTGGHGIVGVAALGGGWAFYAQVGNYGPFTGAHDGLLDSAADIALGDIVVDVAVKRREGIDNVLTSVAPSSAVAQRGVAGVLTRRLPLSADDEFATFPPNRFGESGEGVKRALARRYDRVLFNALGEGQINVCGRGGDLSPGDFICASDMAGKGQRQNDADGAPDDVFRRCTVAQVREAVTFDHPDQVKLVACFYRCG